MYIDTSRSRARFAAQITFDTEERALKFERFCNRRNDCHGWHTAGPEALFETDLADIFDECVSRMIANGAAVTVLVHWRATELGPKASRFETACERNADLEDEVIRLENDVFQKLHARYLRDVPDALDTDADEYALGAIARKVERLTAAAIG